jgi:hypothetical protein
MKNGGWLDNYNDSEVSLPEGYVGEGYDTTGRNYSPAWGGQFEDGGLIPMAQNGRATRADSLALYNNALNKIKFYKNNSDYIKDFSGTNFKSAEVRKNLIKNYKNVGPDNRVRKWLIDEMIENAEEENKPLTSTEKLALKKQLNTVKFGPVGGTNLTSFGDIVREQFDTYYNPLSPPIYLHPNISPQGSEQYMSRRFSDTTDIPYYDPIAVKPFDLLTDAEKKLRVKKYGTDGVPKSYINANKEKPELQPEVKAVKISPIEQSNISTDLEINTAPMAKMPSSFDVSMQRYNMQGPSDYYKTNQEGVDYETAMRIKAASDAYNKYIQEKYGNKEALKNPKAAERLKQLRSEFDITPKYQMGGSIPGAVGFSYARTQSPAPSNGPYAKKTKASAKDGEVIKDDLGQWAHPGEITEIGSNQITMEGVPYDVLGISDTGDTKLMKPGKNYKFKGKKVTEYPMAKNGLRQEQKGLVNLDQLTNFTNYNTKQPGGWLDKY